LQVSCSLRTSVLKYLFFVGKLQFVNFSALVPFFFVFKESNLIENTLFKVVAIWLIYLFICLSALDILRNVVKLKSGRTPKTKMDYSINCHLTWWWWLLCKTKQNKMAFESWETGPLVTFVSHTLFSIMLFCLKVQDKICVCACVLCVCVCVCV